VQEQLEIRVLGPFEVLVGEVQADVGGAKRQGLLAMLALRRGRMVAVDALIDGLWGAELPSAPRNALHHHVARLRAALGEGAILGSADGYALADSRIDAVEFELLLAETRAALRDGDVSAAADSVAAAAGLWRGPALQGLTGTPWFDAEAGRLESLHVDALEEQFEVALALGEHRELVPELRSALADNPFRERLWGQLMLALYRSGRQADALETFQEARRVLSDELGLEPGPELRRLQEAILAQDAAIAAFPAGRRRRGNLPAPASSFVGRDGELARVGALLHEHRLVTLTGPPGVGKSRLAVETARSLEPEFPDGIWVVDFGRAGKPADGVRLLADVLEVRGSDPLTDVASRLRHAGALVVLDACEHILDEAGRIASILLAESARVRILATSREALHLPGEARAPVAPLAVPAPGTDGGSPAVELFLERARAARPGFEADGEAMALAAEIARRLDGLPLALELVAARVNVLGLSELVSILERRAALLRDSPASDPARAALQGLVDWSYDLLHGDEKTLLHQLAVHRGGASRDSLVAIATTTGLNEATVNYLLSALVDKSIVTVSFPGGTARYDMLDSVREYVLDRLAEAGSLGAVRHSHADYFAGLALEARAGLRGPDWKQWRVRLDGDNDNLWAALAYATEAHDSGVAARLGTLGWYFALDERVSEGRRFLELAQGATTDDEAVELRVELLATLCYVRAEELDMGAAIEAGERALELASNADAPRELGLAQLTLANAYGYSGDAVRAEATARDALATLEAAGDDWGVAAAALILAVAAAPSGDVTTVAEMAATVHQHANPIAYEAFRVPALLLEAWASERREEPTAAAEAYTGAAELADAVGFGDHAAFALACHASLPLSRGDVPAAETLARRALATAEAAGATWAAAFARVQLARCAAATGDAATAEQLYRDVLGWSEARRPHLGRESLFVALAGNPVTRALLGLAELAEASGDAVAAEELRARADLALA